ncbi:MAG: Zn-ribbon domain-containing OB-fold protein [Deltaproteobacteria bacterium]|nr:Zn-ribbon domain-containing OB-fold protein [Deltaproteobacteria bacterium]MBW1818111.1 Zn-ribbon domain-containing OB-fold protein [Deltaproteobacteria bacterium]
MTKHFSTMEHDVWLPYRFALGPAFYKWFEGLKEEKIWGTKCPKCGKVLVPARSFCPDCNADMDEWVEVAQEGEIVAWVQANRPFYGAPVEPPFIAALIRLDGTACNFLHLVGGLDGGDAEAAKAKVRRGSRVKAVWADEKKGHMLDLKYFQPV